MRLSKRAIDAIVPGARDIYVFDSDTVGFGIKVTPTGRRVYFVQYRTAGVKRRYTIGVHGSPWTVEEARREALRLLGLVAQGQNPAEIKAAEKNVVTVAELCDLYIKEGTTTKKPSTVYVDRSRIERHIKPLLGNKRVDTLSRGDVERFQQDVAAGKTSADIKTGLRGRAIVSGGRGAASHCLGLLGAILTFAVNRGLRPDNPARGVKKFSDAKIERFLSEAELFRLGETLRQAEVSGTNPVAIAALRLLLLTGCRRGEVLNLEWSHVDFERAYLRLPDSKTGAKVVHLGAPALSLLAELPRLEGNPFVFPGSVDGRPLADPSRIWQRIRNQAGIPDLRIHDMRHEFASVGAASGMGLLIIGKLLGHAQASTTQRYAHLGDDPVKSAADRISSHIAAALEGAALAEVVPLQRRAR